MTKTVVKDKTVTITVSNTGTTDEAITGLDLSWPTTNGKLLQVKRDGAIIYDTPDIAPPSASLTLAQLVADPNKRKITRARTATPSRWSSPATPARRSRLTAVRSRPAASV